LLHRHDLESAHAMLCQLSSAEWPGGDELARRQIRTVALHGAVATYFRCFDSESRWSLQDEQVFRGEPAALRLHRHWRAMRHGHVAHDSNPWTEAQALVEVDGEGRALGTYAMGIFGVIDDPETIKSLGQPVEFVLLWVLAESERALAELDAQVMALTAEKVAALAAPTWTAPTADQASAKR